jgi:hypothetical protein
MGAVFISDFHGTGIVAIGGGEERTKRMESDFRHFKPHPEAQLARPRSRRTPAGKNLKKCQVAKFVGQELQAFRCAEQRGMPSFPLQPPFLPPSERIGAGLLSEINEVQASHISTTLHFGVSGHQGI